MRLRRTTSSSWRAGARCLALLALAAAVAVSTPPREASGAGEGSPTSGDTNGDGRVDLSDAVFLLDWLFRGGPEIAPCAATGGGDLPATGVEDCHDFDGEPIDCGSESVPGQDGAVRAGCPAAGRFELLPGGVVHDRCTGLEWRADTTTDAPALDWRDALQWADLAILAADGTWHLDPADATEHGGVLHDDWRLPNVRELESIVDYGEASPAVAASFSTRPAGYWTSTPAASNPARAWCVNFFEGSTETISKVASLRVTVVRGGR